ncbi:MAG: mechanosensitive ion channel family protein, partial [Paraglaciecola sp.]|nr:mechanosensitive ion channel family protein [Paraglaciecola sp.]
MIENQILTENLLSLLAHFGIQATPKSWVFQAVALSGILLIAWLSNWLTKGL